MPVGITGLTTTDLDTEELIQKLVDVERLPIERMLEEQNMLYLRKEVLELMDRQLVKLRASVKNLFGFESVFRRKKAYGTDEKYFTATPNQYALPGDLKMEISQIASAHSVASKSFDPATEFPAGVLTIHVGTNAVRVDFEGGTAEDLVRAINSGAGTLINASLINDTEDTVILHLTSLLTGEANRITIDDPSKVLGVIPLVVKKEPVMRELAFGNELSADRLNPYRGYQEALARLTGTSAVRDGRFVLSAAASEFGVEVIRTEPGVMMQVTCEFREKEEEPDITGPGQKEGEVTRIFSAQVREIEILGAPFPVNEEGLPDPGVVSPDTAGLGAGFGIAYEGDKRIEKLFPFETGTNFFTADVPVDKGFEQINRIIFYSGDPERELVVHKVRIYSKKDGGYDFAQTLQEPGNARFKVNDIEVERPYNDGIDDVIKNVSLDLKAPMEKPIKFSVDHDFENIENELLTFISNYYQPVELIHETRRTSSAEKPGDYDPADRGIFSTDMEIGNLRSKMRSMVMAPYPTSASNRVALLQQIGVSTGKWGSAFDDVRMGLLKYDEKLFMETFRKYPRAVTELFGNDTDGDSKLDNGVAYAMDEFLRLVLLPKAGVMDVKIARTEEDIRAKKKQIEKKEEQVEAYEEKLKLQFLNMDKDLQKLKSQEEWLKHRLNAEKDK